jgi:hypothetical protein
MLPDTDGDELIEYVLETVVNAVKDFIDVAEP